MLTSTAGLLNGKEVKEVKIPFGVSRKSPGTGKRPIFGRAVRAPLGGNSPRISRAILNKVFPFCSPIPNLAYQALQVEKEINLQPNQS